MTTWTYFNINYNVRVRLTDYGRAVHRHEHDSLVARMPEPARKNIQYSPPVEDDEGWSTWQMWVLMETFGPHMSLAGESCFATDIMFETKA